MVLLTQIHELSKGPETLKFLLRLSSGGSPFPRKERAERHRAACSERTILTHPFQRYRNGNGVVGQGLERLCRGRGFQVSVSSPDL